MDAREFKDRTMRFGMSVMDAVEALPRKLIPDILGRQVVRSSTSVGANYRAACRAKSTADFIYKMELVEEEVDESAYGNRAR
jgi:four helix bundle protein